MQKWSPEEDDRLKKLVKKHGSQWRLISKQMDFTRSEKAVSKRWHDYVKKEVELDELLKQKKAAVKATESKSVSDVKKKVTRSDDRKQLAPTPAKTKIIKKTKKSKQKKSTEKRNEKQEKQKQPESQSENQLENEEQNQDSEQEVASENSNNQKAEEQQQQESSNKHSQIQTKKLRSHAQKKIQQEQKTIKNHQIPQKNYVKKNQTKPVEEKKNKPSKKQQKKQQPPKKQSAIKQKPKKQQKMKDNENLQMQEKNQNEAERNSLENDDLLKNEEMERMYDEEIKKMINQNYEWEISWSEQKDRKLANLIISEHCLSWEYLAEFFKVSLNQVRLRWIKIVFPKIRTTVKIGGAVKWCPNEDQILFSGHKKEISFINLMFFLPGRTIYSMQARWRRISRNNELGEKESIITPSVSKYTDRNDILTKIALKRKQRRKEEMNKIFERERQIMERKKRECQHFKLFEKLEKVKKSMK